MRPRLQASGFWACVLVVGFVSHRANADSNSPRGSTKRMCFHCHSPFACAVGFCYGDYCVKSLVGDKYVSKGCENRSASMYARSLLMDPSGQENIAGCTETPVFGVPNVVCYCNDNDWCNSSTRLQDLPFLLSVSCSFTLFSFLLGPSAS